MIGPGWLAPFLAALMLLITASTAIRLVRWRRHRNAEPDVDALHALMAMAMAGMLLPQLSLISGRIWQALFAAAAAWLVARAMWPRGRQAGLRRLSNMAPHVIECAVMIYMLIPARGHDMARMTMPGMAVPTLSNPVVTVLFAAVLIGYMFWSADQITASRRKTAPACSPQPSEAQVASAERQLAHPVQRGGALDKIIMGAAMGYMLLTML